MPRQPKPFFRKDRQTWYVQIRGKQYRLAQDETLAFQKYHELMAQFPRVEVDCHSVAFICDQFLEWTLHNRSEATFVYYRERLQAFLSMHPDLLVHQLKPFHVQRWVDSNPTWSDGHRRGLITTIKRAFNWALKSGHIDQNPIMHLEKPPGGRRERILKDEEYAHILSLVKDQEFRDLLTLAWETGARPQELLRVEARHIDLQNRRWVFPREEAKGKKQVRVIYLNEVAWEISERYRLLHPEGNLLRNTESNPWKPTAVNCRFNRIQKKTGEKLCLYNFRHSFATRMLEKGVDGITVAQLMGHRDTTMLGKVYQHLSQNPTFLRQQLQNAS
ncbi:Tyrosine recombinase XerD [Polystyrenella longa]|uniref:Tyrosine recombinase XerD n=1 Tax=Polystyrenella longa TaxID=2528007 RepID=A0A518CTS2_9PLAN|nr:site-specific integrase [Polystyrenella longa]QDU82632.1 Tyrosine recombinase XerD [Polystyrenella longa]